MLSLTVVGQTGQPSRSNAYTDETSSVLIERGWWIILLVVVGILLILLVVTELVLWLLHMRSVFSVYP